MFHNSSLHIKTKLKEFNELNIIETLNNLIKMEADINFMSPLKEAIFGLKDLHIIDFLINNGANVNETNYYMGKDRTSFLMEVCHSDKLGRKKFDIAKLLIDKGANIHYVDEKKNNLLFYLKDSHHDKFIINQYTDENGEMITDESNTFLFFLAVTLNWIFSLSQ